MIMITEKTKRIINELNEMYIYQLKGLFITIFLTISLLWRFSKNGKVIIWLDNIVRSLSAQLSALSSIKLSLIKESNIYKNYI